MKSIYLLFLTLLFSCASSDTMMTGSWKSNEPGLKNYKNILVASLTGHTASRATLENDIAGLLEKENVHSVKGLDLFPPSMNNHDSSHATVMKKVREQHLDAILTISLLKKETESRYVAGGYDPMVFTWYPNFWGYYSYWYPYSYNPGYYTESTVYYLETNLYDAKTEKLAWSAQSKTYDLLSEPGFAKVFARQVVQKMLSDGIIKENGKYD
jgi:hypothetical protein